MSKASELSNFFSCKRETAFQGTESNEIGTMVNMKENAERGTFRLHKKVIIITNNNKINISLNYAF